LIHDNQILDAMLFIAVLGPSVIFHEVAHGFVALRLGDVTARDAGRLTLNPFKHIDPFGSVLLPGMLAASGQNVFGWAKPVPVNPAYFEHPTQGMAITSLAGPATNLALAAVFARFAPLVELDGALFRTDDSIVSGLLIAAVFVNAALAIFNMLPIPPLDGSRLLPLFLSEEGKRLYWEFSKYGFLILFVILFILPDRFGFLSDLITGLIGLLV